MPTALYRTYKEYAGFLVRGEVPVPVPDSSEPHVVRAAYLLSQMEAANYGTVQSYDGCGISAGPLHAIAFSPASKQQGALWPLIADIFAQVPKNSDPAVDELRQFLRSRGVNVTPLGRLVYIENGKKVTGEDIRSHLFRSPFGFVPASGPAHEAAKQIVLTFHHAFSSSSTFNAQQQFTVKWLLRGNTNNESAAYSKYAAMPVQTVDMPNFLATATQTDLGVELDLAMCVYHAFTVNGPTPAAQCLMAAATAKTAVGFAKILIRKLGTHTYGRWADSDDNRNRYDKTRLAVMKLPYWDRELVSGLMPENL